MNNIKIHIEKTEILLNKINLDLKKSLEYCENDLVSYEIRESLLKIERKENKFNSIKNNLLNNYNKKDSAKLKLIYKSLKKLL